MTVEIHKAKSISKLCPKLILLLFIWSNTFASPEVPCSTHPVKGIINLWGISQTGRYTCDVGKQAYLPPKTGSQLHNASRQPRHLLHHPMTTMHGPGRSHLTGNTSYSTLPWRISTTVGKVSLSYLTSIGGQCQVTMLADWPPLSLLHLLPGIQIKTVSINNKHRGDCVSQKWTCATGFTSASAYEALQILPWSDGVTSQRTNLMEVQNLGWRRRLLATLS